MPWEVVVELRPQTCFSDGANPVATDKVSGAGQREHRADDLVWVALVTGHDGPVLRFMRSDAQRQHFFLFFLLLFFSIPRKRCGSQIS